MTETPTPLARLRAQLAGPRGFRRIEALVTSDDPAASVAALAPNEVFELVHEVGFEDGQELIALATPEQLVGCFDLDGWQKDHIELTTMRPWLMALIDAGYEKVGAVWAALDAELRALILQRVVKVYDVSLGEDPDEDPTRDQEIPVMATPDRFFMLELHGDDDQQRLSQRIVEDLYRADMALAQHTIMAARSEPAAELEEQSYRWRAGRLADLGYVDFYDALELFRPLDPEQVAIGEGTQDAGADAPTSLVLAEETLGRSFLARAIDAAGDDESPRIEAALTVLVNKVLAAGRAKPGQTEVVRRGALYATATVSLGLETIARGDVGRAAEALKTIGIQRLFRVGYTVSAKLARLAQALAAKSVLAGSPARDLVAGLCSPRPLFARLADDPPAAGLRPFEAQADLRRAAELLTGLTVRIALVESLGVDLVAMGVAPEPRPGLDDFVRTAIARVLAGGDTLRADALTQGELAAIRKGGFADAAKRRAHDAIAERLGAAQLKTSAIVLARLVDAWLAELEDSLGAIEDGDVDPRFVDGVIVEARRS